MDRKNETKSLGTFETHPKARIDEETVGIRCPRCDYLIPSKGCEGLSKGGDLIITEQDDLLTVVEKVDVEKKDGGNGDGVIVAQGLANGNVEHNVECKVGGELMKVDGKYIEFPNSEFYNFDQCRKKDSFATGQMWAIYDDKLDVMPRSYAQIVKVFSPGFKVEITWLEADPDDVDEINWVSKDLPVACGKFKYGETDVTEDLEMFSHAVNFTKVGDGFLVYPRKGETWAIFKSWDIKWSSNADNHKNYEFDFVEILADYDKQSGSVVGYLEKVEGFVCLFKPKKGASSFHIPPHEILRFSHMVPRYRTTGKERGGVPDGYFELDPASLPAYLIKGVKEIPPLPQQHENNIIPIQQQLGTGPKWSRLPDFSSVVGYQGKIGHGTATSQTLIENETISADHIGSTINAVSGADRTGRLKRPKLSGVTHNASRKRKKSLVTSSMNHDTGSNHGNDELGILVKTEDSVPVGANSQIPKGYKIRLPAREKHQIIKTQETDDEFCVGPHKDNRQLTVVEDESKMPLKEVELKNIKADGFATHHQINIISKKRKGRAPFGKSSGNGNVEDEPRKIFEKEAAAIGNNVQKIKPGGDMKLQSSYKTRPDLESTEIAEPEFYDFNNDRMGDCFETDQVWAVYDSMDGMPRLYARIRKVFSPVFKVKITWLDFDSKDEELPVSCGKFKYGETETTENLYMFSHRVTCRKHAPRGSLAIYPRKGETWGLFKNWDLKWNSNPENYKNYEYELVEILSDYSERSGIRVAYLEKLKGFVSLFRRKGATSFQIPPNELQRFSHMVPSYRTTDKETDAPEGSLELDPASLPCNIKELAEVDPKEVDVTCSESPEENAKQLGPEEAATAESVV